MYPFVETIIMCCYLLIDPYKVLNGYFYLLNHKLKDIKHNT